MSYAGRVCPARYHYGAETLARAPEHAADTLYVVGGLYGNRFALEALDALIAGEDGSVTVVFNGDFHWFDVDDAGFAEVDRRVAAHHAIVGNVEAELTADGNDAGCGCAYPASVDTATVERSNRIHARLKATAEHDPAVLTRLAGLPMVMRWRVGAAVIGVVHGDADALAGWRFDPAALDEPGHLGWIESSFLRAQVDVFASSHTCRAGLRAFSAGIVVNNGAAGIGNAPGETQGRITRISTLPSPHVVLDGKVCKGVHIDALALAFDARAWERAFLANWPRGSDAHTSYWSRVTGA